MLTIILIIIGFFFLIVGADLLVKGSSDIAKKFHIPEILIGLTIVALGTSLPELVIAISSAKKGCTDLILGEVVGSNICNLLLILGVIALLKPIKIDKDTKIIHLPVAYMFVLLILIAGLGLFGSMPSIITKKDGFILLIVFLIYFISLIVIEIVKDGKIKKEKTNKKSKIKVIPSIIYIFLGTIFLKYGGDLVVNEAKSLAIFFGLTERIIGLTIVALGTSLPELITSVVAIIKKDDDLAVGNLVGSCILNSGLILGVGAYITPIIYSTIFNEDLVLLAIAILFILLSCFIGKKNILTRKKALVLIIMFVFHIWRVF